MRRAVTAVTILSVCLGVAWAGNTKAGPATSGWADARVLNGQVLVDKGMGQRSGTITVHIYPSPAPNAYGGTAWNNYVTKALYALENELAINGDRLTDPSAYVRAGAVVSGGEIAVTSFNSWRGVVDPPAPFADQYGNRMHFGLHAFGDGSTQFTLEDLTFELHSSDAGDSLLFTGDFIGYSYSATRYGINWGPDRVKGGGDDIIYNSGNGQTLVDEIVYVGVGNAWWPGAGDANPSNPAGGKQKAMDSFFDWLAREGPIDVYCTYNIGAASNTASVSVAHENIHGFGTWLSDDTRGSTGTDLVGLTLTHYGKPGQTPTAADDTAIASQIQFVRGPGDVPALKLTKTSIAGGYSKSTISTVDEAGFAADDWHSGFFADYRYYAESTAEVGVLKIGVRSPLWGTGTGQSQNGYTALRSGESAWDLVLVDWRGSQPPWVTGAWTMLNTDANTQCWYVYKQANNSFFSGAAPQSSLSRMVSLNDLYAMNDANNPTHVACTVGATKYTWSQVFFGTGTKVTSVQFGVGSSVQTSNSYIDFIETSLLGGGARVDFGAPEVTLNVYPSMVPDEQQPLVHLGDAPSGFGPDSWQNAATGKVNWHARYLADGDALSKLFPGQAATLTVNDLESIDYWTKRPAGTTAGQDWAIFLYTRARAGADGTWFGFRFVNNYEEHTALDAWESYTTDSGMTFRKNSGTATGLMDFATLKAAYGTELVEMISVQTMSNWSGVFAGYMDGLTITLTNGKVGRVNFVRQPSVTTEPDSACYAPGQTVTVELWMHDTPDTIVGGQFFLSYDTSRLAFVSADPAPAVFTRQVYENVDTGSGLIDYAVGTANGAPGTSGEARMAVLTFTSLAQICDTAGLVAWRTHDPASYLSDQYGNQVAPLLRTHALVDDVPPSITCPPDVTIECDASTAPASTGALLTLPFDTNPVLGATQAPGVWYTDRYAPAGFVSAVFDGDNRLKHSIATADGANNRPGGYSGGFYDTQGRKYDLPAGTTHMTVDLYVPADWQTTERRMAGFWGTAFNAASSVSAYPIIEFTSTTDGSGGPRFRGWNDAAGWIDMGLPTGFAFDAWYTLEIELVGSNFVYTVGDLTLTVSAFDSVQIGNVILQGHNTTTGVDYDIYWDNFVAGQSTQATDNCDWVPTITYSDAFTPDPSCAYVGVLTRTWQAADHCGNSATCTQTITVIDTVAPVATAGSIAACYPDVASAEAAAIAATSASDNCAAGGQLTMTASTVGACAAVVTVRVTDCAGNWDEVTYNTRIDNAAPVIAGSVAGGSVNGTCGATIAVSVTVTDDCGVQAADVTYSMTTTSGTLTYTGLTKVQTSPTVVTISGNAVLTALTACSATVSITVDAIDECANAAGTFSTSGNWSDTTPPTITCPASVVVNADAGLCTATLTRVFDFELFDPPDYDYYADAGCTAERTAFGTGYAAHLQLNNSMDYARVRAPLTGFAGLTVANVSAMFQAYVLPGSTANLGPYVMLDVDANGNGTWDGDSPTGDAIIIAFVTGAAPYTQGCWYTDGLNGTTTVHVVGNRTGLAAAEFSSSAGGGLLSTLRTHTLSGSAVWGDLQVLNVRVGAGLWPGSGYFECYVDDLIVAKALELPPGGADNCDAPAITGVRSDALPLDAPYPAFTTITWTATDCCGNSAMCSQTVTVDAFNELVADVDLEWAFTGSRCITFELFNSACAAPVVQPEVLTFAAGHASAVLLVPCGDYTCITARDKLHTLRRTATPTVAGTQYAVDFTAAAGKQLLGGNLNDDKFVDILDFGVFSWQWHMAYAGGSPLGVFGTLPGGADGDTLCTTAFPHADITGDGWVEQDDYNFIAGHFLQAREANCCGLPNKSDDEQPVTRIAVSELNARGLGYLAVADLNRDGWLDTADVSAFLSGTTPKPVPTIGEFEAKPVGAKPRRGAPNSQ